MTAPTASFDPFPIVYPREAPLEEGRLVRRYNRFLADIENPSGEIITAHCVNTGAMEGLTRPGLRVWYSRADNPKRKLAYTWELTEVEGAAIGTNTGFPNRLTRRLLEERRLPWLARWEELRCERPYGENSRIDFWMREPRGRERYLEVKNCHLVYPDRRAYFPDTVSERAAKHLRELAALVGPKTRAEVLFFVQIPGVKSVRPSDVHDPAFAQAARQARAAGVRFSAIALRQSPREIIVEGRIPVDLKPYGKERPAKWRAQNRQLKNTPAP